MSDFAAQLDAILAQMDAETSPAVKIWMNWMGLIFMASLLFVWKYKAARWAVLTFGLTMLGGVICWAVFKNVHLFGIVHLVIWLPLGIYLWRTVLSPAARAGAPERQGNYHRAFMIWAVLLFLTIAVSLVFDVRDIYLVMIGAK